MNFLTEEQLNKLNTKRLLALYKSTRKYLNLNDNCGDGINYTVAELEKNQPIYDYRTLIKSILDNREHVDKDK